MAYQFASFPHVPASVTKQGIIHLSCIHHLLALVALAQPILTILAPGLPLATVASFVTCQLIRPHRHITSVGRQQGLEQLQSLFFKKSYQMFTESYPKGFNGSLSMLPTEQHLQVSKRCDFINSSTGSGSYQGPRFFLFSSKHCDRYKWRGIATHATLQHSLAARTFCKVLVHHCSPASEP